MALCEVCSTEPSKYRCPICNVQSCSLACIQAHKTSCSPKAIEQNHESEKQTAPLYSVQNCTSGTAPGDACGRTTHPNLQIPHNPETILDNEIPKTPLDFKDLESSHALKNLFAQYPALRSQLRDIYKLTLEEEWVETKHNNYGRGRGRGRGGFSGRGGRSRGPWNEEKGFNRGLGKVRRLRETLESNNWAANSNDIEGFARFATLVLGDNDAPRDTMQLQPEG
ncbi:hypothetical protein ACJ73_01993 [Blastomyces percursus]|uniref:HIT-type domain-containing protein n=1 Tax=Blastomyces percursus TaxID=1658174 RepID=A0A1J9QDM3_9EURO|nr:hypothetical protein ACJ73_01993 [Blastomyces percursus]